MFRDGLSYGMGVVTPTWDRKWDGNCCTRLRFYVCSFGRFMSTGKVRGREECILFEGNRLKNIDPYSYLQTRMFLFMMFSRVSLLAGLSRRTI